MKTTLAACLFGSSILLSASAALARPPAPPAKPQSTPVDAATRPLSRQSFWIAADPHVPLATVD